MRMLDEAQFDNDENDENGNDEIRFYKSWDTYSALSNFSAHAVDIDGENWLTSEFASSSAKIRRFATGRCKNKKRYSQSEFTRKRAKSDV